MEKDKIHNSEEEIDLSELFRTIWRGKKTIIRFITIFGIIGLFIAIFSEKQYVASTTVVLQTGGSKVGSNLGGLAAIAGINLGGGSTGGLSTALYPQIVQSVPFQRELLNVSLKFSNVKEEITYREYYEKYKKNNILSVIRNYTIGLPGKVINLFKKEPNNNSITEMPEDSIYRVSVKEYSLFKQLKGQLGIDNNKKGRFIKISFSMPEALPSAQMAQKARELLQKSITNFKIQKTKEEYTFIEERYNELKKDFSKKQAVLASFRDRNQGLITSRSQSRLESLQSESNLAFSIYSELAKQLETQKIKLKENTPIFTIIEPVSVPVIKSKPKRIMILFIWLFLGTVFGMGFLLGKKWLKSLNTDKKVSH
ncbi:Wzz/FepE/Etk N-terminal domain-containing protein [Tenacibaculum ovolyticum]|uniref:Wzz/FepE/Etk N-terminal domain-containing protein n=1 Tax=Tenacibaculum ovolyticum TaxID=104270 RepID=UPI001EED97B4|nr:Wzz/FepE/Etk N-terminal domain-containing protein [Tenacibaculum ovolyticum]